MTPKQCPVCCSNSIGLILRDAFLTAHIGGLSHPSSGAVAYHCDSGHVFLVVTEDFGWKEPIMQDSGFYIVV